METVLTDMSREELLRKATNLQDDVNVLTKFKEDLIINSNKVYERLTNMQENLKVWTRQQLRDELITVEQATDLSEIGDFTLTQSYDVTVTVEHTFTVDVQLDEDIDDIIGSVEFNVNSYHTELMNEDYNVIDTNYDPIDQHSIGGYRNRHAECL